MSKHWSLVGGMLLAAAFVAVLLVGLFIGHATGYRTARGQFERPCTVTCGVRFIEGGRYEVTGGERKP